jgi:hypothetical protein
MRNSGLKRSAQDLSRLLALLCFLSFLCHGQSGVTGLGRLYVEPFGNGMDVLVTAAIVQQGLPITTLRTPEEADCVLFWTPLAESSPSKSAAKPFGKLSQGKVKIEGNMELFDRQQQTLVWELSLTTKKFDDLSFSDEKKLAEKIVHGMNQRGAYCGGAAFNAPAQGAAERTKAFKPPFFNW